MPDKPRILIVDEDLRERAELQQFLAKSRFIVVGGVGHDEEALNLASELKPQVTLVSLEGAPAEAFGTVQSFADRIPGVPIIAYFSLDDIHSVRRAMAAGAWEYLTAPLSLEQLTSTIERVLIGETGQTSLEEASLPKLDRSGTIVTVFGAKGGIGKTLLAVNLAASLSELGASTALVDLDPVFGDVARTLKTRTDRSFLDAAQRAAELDEWTIDSYLSPHPCGLKVLSAPRLPTDWREIDAEAVSKLLTLVAKVHEFVIIDTPATLTDLVVLALHRANVVLLLSSPDPASVESTDAVLQMLASASLPHGEVKLTLNQPQPTGHLSDADPASELPHEVFFSLPYDENITYRDDVGRPVVLGKPKAMISRSILKMASLLIEARLPVSARPAGRNGSGIFARLLGD